MAAPVQPWVALRPSSVESRFEALRTSTTPLVGRDEEIELLLRRWEQAKGGDGSSRDDFGRARDRQIAHRSDRAGAARERAAHPPALFLLTSSSGQRALSEHHPVRAGGRIPARGHGRATARQSWRRCSLRGPTISRGRSPAGGLAVDPDGRPLPAAGSHPAEAQGEDAAGPSGAGRRTGGAPTGADGVRGHALERPHHARIA